MLQETPIRFEMKITDFVEQKIREYREGFRIIANHCVVRKRN